MNIILVLSLFYYLQSVLSYIESQCICLIYFFIDDTISNWRLFKKNKKYIVISALVRRISKILYMDFALQGAIF